MNDADFLDGAIKTLLAPGMTLRQSENSFISESEPVIWVHWNDSGKINGKEAASSPATRAGTHMEPLDLIQYQKKPKNRTVETCSPTMLLMRSISSDSGPDSTRGDVTRDHELAKTHATMTAISAK